MPATASNAAMALLLTVVRPPGATPGDSPGRSPRWNDSISSRLPLPPLTSHIPRTNCPVFSPVSGLLGWREYPLGSLPQRRLAYTTRLQFERHHQACPSLPISRSCTRRCKFCQADCVRLPRGSGVPCCPLYIRCSRFKLGDNKAVQETTNLSSRFKVQTILSPYRLAAMGSTHNNADSKPIADMDVPEVQLDDYVADGADKEARNPDNPEWIMAQKRYLRKLDLIILPTISALYFFEYLDRGNVAVRVFAPLQQGRTTDLVAIECKTIRFRGRS